ncbi:tail fiber domain-containing protein [Liberibacter crescens]|nr:tail fiber domain-containing protein [Liberibacter crescens]
MIRDPFTGNMMEIPQYSAIRSLSPQAQAIHDQQNANRQSLSRLAARKINTLQPGLAMPLPGNNAPAGMNVSSIQGPQLQNLDLRSGDIVRDYGTADVKHYENALFSRLEPFLQQNHEAMETKLVNQGLAPGSVAWDRAMDERNRAENDARLAAVLTAGQEQDRIENRNAQRMMSHNAAQAQAYQQEMASRMQPINEALALMQGAYSPEVSFSNPSPMPVMPVQYSDLVSQDYQNRLARWQDQQKKFREGLSLGSKLLTGFSALSDVRAKTDIKRVGGLYQYRYKTDPEKVRRIGVLAQEIDTLRPDAVFTGSKGLKCIDYGRLFGFPATHRHSQERKTHATR